MLRRLVPELQAHLIVKAIDSLRVTAHPPGAAEHPRLGDLLDPAFEVACSLRFGL